MEIKLFDKKDYDYYNPKPYITHLISFFDTQMQNQVSYDMDNDCYDYLFMYLTNEDRNATRKKKRVFCGDFLNLVKQNHMDRVIKALERAAINFAENLKNKVDTYKRRIKNAEQGIKEQLETIEREKKELKELEDVIKKYTTQDKTGTPELPF